MSLSYKAISYDCITYKFVKNCNRKLLSDSHMQQENWMDEINPYQQSIKQFQPLVILSLLFKLLNFGFMNNYQNFPQNGILKEQIGLQRVIELKQIFLSFLTQIKNTKTQEGQAANLFIFLLLIIKLIEIGCIEYQRKQNLKG
ncbi:unnamed protein product [Paramecium octaurelia]|uniref:Transmembrane protein n=1 Tax=Paramecium octaurelia TaxID=43137 RepID=A0A8S1VWC9_PAROT|nr:unnamed protein product [Paramecium octaurelia]CAD8182198.1 unnamed protein product [Paramecium octaurelia]